MWKNTLCFLIIPFVITAQESVKFSKTIIAEDLERHLNILASDSLEGRETGKSGQKMAADYIMNYFKSIGIPPYKRKKYYQKFKIRSDRLSRILKKKVVVKGENVLGYIEGTDLKKELLVISAHYDHLGKKDSLIFNGADDNASGTAAIMEIAQAFMIAKKEGRGPRRSVLIVAFSGEEKGLLGSKYYTRNPVFPLEKTVANLNIDMIGRLDELHQEDPNYIYLIGADRLSQELHDISEQVNEKHIKLELDYTYNKEDDPNRYYYRSDHYNFAKNNIPVIFYFNGVHEDYHKPTDTIEKIDFDKIQKIARLVFLTAWEVANKEERIVVDKDKN